MARRYDVDGFLRRAGAPYDDAERAIGGERSEAVAADAPLERYETAQEAPEVAGPLVVGKGRYGGLGLLCGVS